MHFKNDTITGNQRDYLISSTFVINLSDYSLRQIITQPSELLRSEMEKDDGPGFQHYS